MPSQSQIMINDGISEVSPQRTYGDRNQANLNQCFPASPIYSGVISDDGLKATYDQIINGKPTDDLESGTGLTYKGGSGLGMSSFDTDYLANGAPDIAANTSTTDGKEFGAGEGAPSSPYVPPLTSATDMTAASQPAFDTESGTLPAAGNEYGSGYGATSNPSVTSAEVDNQTLGGLISGRSYLNSDTLG